MRDQILDIAKKLYHNHLTIETGTDLLFGLHSVSQQRELFDAILDFTEDLPMCSEDYNRDTLYKRYIAENCG